MGKEPPSRVMVNVAVIILLSENPLTGTALVFCLASVFFHKEHILKASDPDSTPSTLGFYAFQSNLQYHE